MKSCTISSREGNSFLRYVDLQLGSINSMELQNLDFEFYLDYAQKEHKSGNDNLFFSVAGLTLEDNIEILITALLKIKFLLIRIFVNTIL